MNKSAWFFLVLVLSGIMLISGCSLFDDDGRKSDVKLNSPQTKDKTAPKKEEKKTSRRRDPTKDMFFGIGKGAETPVFSSGELNGEERQIVGEELRHQNDEIKALRQRHQDNYDSNRSTRQEWVYGIKPLNSR